MSSKVPQDIRDKIQEKLWKKANELRWSFLSDQDRAAWYENWAKEESVGGVLAHFMDPRRVRVYIKDSLLKPYQNSQLEEKYDAVLGALGLGSNTQIRRTFDKPQGRMLLDGRIISWGNARDWKGVVLATFERAFKTGERPYAVALLQNNRPTPAGVREMAETAATRLGIERIEWID